MISRSRPCAICSSCNAYSYDTAAINTVCNRKLEKGSCNGYWQNRTRLNDWQTCNACSGTGYLNQKRCPQCKSIGWLSTR